MLTYETHREYSQSFIRGDSGDVVEVRWVQILPKIRLTLRKVVCSLLKGVIAIKTIWYCMFLVSLIHITQSQIVSTVYYVTKKRILVPPSRAPHRVVTHILLSNGVKPHHLDLQFVSNPDLYRVLAIVLHFIHLYLRCFDDLVFFFYLFILSNFSQKHALLEYEMMQLL